VDEPTLVSTQRPSLPEPERPGTVIAGYTLLRALGEGGFGTVYEAEQTQPVRRRVALKLIKPGMGSAELLARFALERQALARMDHPHIATVLDGGATADGRPFFVMELVEGETITRYCEHHQLGLAQRMELLVQVCEAVQHAHGRGLIHRDLKPGNVLVTRHDGRGFAKVIDFGIAKAINPELDGASPMTAFNVLVGTPAYMSPEQAAGSPDIDTRSDIYALGVLLYELLTGSTPHEADTLRGASSYEIQRILREVEPPTPSARLRRRRDTPDGGRRRPPPEALNRSLRGELDWIVMKAIDKDRERRYATASELAADLRRYLAGQPVLAAPPSRLYRLRKLVGRHRLASAALGLLLLSLVGGVLAVVWQARIAAERADELARVLEFEQGVFDGIDPAAAGAALGADVLRRLDAALAESGLDPAARAAQRGAFVAAWQQVDTTDAARTLIDATVLRPAIAGIDAQLADQPRLAAKLRVVFAERYRVFGDIDTALAQAEQARDVHRQLDGADHLATLEIEHAIVGMLRVSGRLDEAETLARDALVRARRSLGSAHETTLGLIGELGSVIQDDGRLAEAEGLIREAYTTQRRLFGLEHFGTLFSMNDLALLLHSQGRFDEAEVLYRELIPAMAALSGEDDADTLSVRGNLAGLLRDQDRLAEAEALQRELLERRRRAFGSDHPDTAFAAMALAELLYLGERHAEAESLLRGVLRRQASSLAASHPDVIRAHWHLADVLLAQEKFAAAADSYREALERSREAFGADHVETLQIELDIAALDRQRGEPAQAEALLAQREAVHLAAFGDDYLHLRARHHHERATALQDLAQPEPAAAQLRKALAAYREAGDSWVDEAAEVADELAEVEGTLGDRGASGE
jgi:eukaryotic-like serine/threonine-protein kinase